MHLRRAFFTAALFSGAALTALSVSHCSPTVVKPLQVAGPVIPGDSADPSLIRVGDDYWAVATSSEWAPQFPIMHSKDLISWEQVGAVFSTPPDWSYENYWAPEIVNDKGRYFVYYVARKKPVPSNPKAGDMLCVAVATADKPEGPYTDHGPLVCQEDGSIDGAVIRDENDKAFLVWKEDGNSRGLPTPIFAQALSEDGTQLVGEKTTLIVNDVPWEGGVVEAPFIMKQGDYFYMFYAGGGCCGAQCNYGEGVARSKHLLSGWEKNPLNPIVKSNATWKCPGHGSVVTDPNGRHFLLYHAYSTQDSIYVGRQSILDEITWNSEGWPTINNRQGPAATRGTAPAFSDDFSGSSMTPGWQWPVGHLPTTGQANGELTLTAAAAENDDVLGAIVARRTTSADYTAVAVLDTAGVSANTQAGLAAVGDQSNAVGIGILNGKAQVWKRQGGNLDKLGDSLAVSGAKLSLRMTAKDGHLFHFAVSPDGTTWTDVGPEVDGAYLPPWDRGVRVGLTAGGTSGASARFDSLNITPAPR